MALPKLQLYTKILLALVAGAVLGLLANRFGFSAPVVTYVNPVGDIFVMLIKMVVVPLVFASLLVGVTRAQAWAQQIAGRIWYHQC